MGYTLYAKIGNRTVTQVSLGSGYTQAQLKAAKQKLRNHYVKNMGNPGRFTYIVKFN
ncbi:MAG: hypothetical protein M0R51_10790 [Clostridia bacterium]|nr:hypothetical protein [Clostridia bacterium]